MRRFAALVMAVQAVVTVGVVAAAVRDWLRSGVRRQEAAAPHMPQTRTAHIIEKRGGWQALARIIDVRSEAGDFYITYQFEARGADGVYTTITGKIETGWLYADVAERYRKGGGLAWREKYQLGYTFPIKYLPSDPQQHMILEAFDFAA